MKNILILAFCPFALSCNKKDNNNPHKIYNKNLSYSQMIDSMQIVFSKKYSIGTGTSSSAGDTVIFNSDQTIKEKIKLPAGGDTTYFFDLSYQIVTMPIIVSANPQDSELIYKIFISQSHVGSFLFGGADTLYFNKLPYKQSDTISIYNKVRSFIFYPIN